MLFWHKNGFHLYPLPFDYYQLPADYETEFVYSSSEENIKTYMKLRRLIGNEKIFLGMINTDRVNSPIYNDRPEIYPIVKHQFKDYLNKTSEFVDGYVRYKVPGQYEISAPSEQLPPFDAKIQLAQVIKSRLSPATWKETTLNYHPKSLGHYWQWSTSNLKPVNINLNSINY